MSRAIPTTFILTKEGRIFEKHVGMREWDSPEMTDKLTTLNQKTFDGSIASTSSSEIAPEPDFIEMNPAEKMASLALTTGESALKDKDYNEAETLFKQCIQLGETKLGPIHRLLAQAYGGLGKTYQVQNRAEEAITRYRKSLSIWSKTSYVDPVSYKQALKGCRELLLKAGKTIEANELEKIYAPHPQAPKVIAPEEPLPPKIIIRMHEK